MKTNARGGTWFAFLTNKGEPKVSEYTSAQPWGHPTRRDALRVLRPTVQVAEKEARKKADNMAAALDAIDIMLEEE